MEEGRITLVAGMEVTKGVHLVRPLGGGGMGAVWLGEHAGLKTSVVVKFMIESFDRSASARARFSREAAAAAQVKSPHVVQMLDHGVTDEGVPFIVMEHLEGKDLSAVLAERGTIEPRDVVVIIAQVAKALSRVHAAGLLHRDIKPSNIFLVDGEDEIFAKLLDFGIAKAQLPEEESAGPLDSETKTGQIVGTPFYMSPEQVTAQKVIDQRSDVWALGVVAWELLVGRRPFDGPSFGALAVAIASGPLPTAPSFLPPSFDAWFAKACARDPAERFATAKQLAEGLRAAFDASSFSLPPATPLLESGSGPRAKPELAFAPTLASVRPELAKSEPGAVSFPAEAKPRAPFGMIAAVVAVAALGVAIWSAREKGRETPQAPIVSPPAASAPLPPAPFASVVPVDASLAVMNPPALVDAAVAAPSPPPVVRPPVVAPPVASSAPPTPRPKPSHDDPLY